MGIHQSFACMECGGQGETACPACGNEEECDGCRGTGIDPVVVDVAAYKRACLLLDAESAGAGMSALSWDVLDGVKTIGRSNGKRDILISAFSTRPAEAP